jgi:hypothetical protein
MVIGGRGLGVAVGAIKQRVRSAAPGCIKSFVLPVKRRVSFPTTPLFGGAPTLVKLNLLSQLVL